MSGVEFLYSIEGIFELEYNGAPYPVYLAPYGPVFVFDAHRMHSIRLSKGGTGKLLRIRYYPQNRVVLPGSPRRGA